MDRSWIFTLKFLRDVREKLQIDGVGDEGCERSEATAEGIEDLEEGVQGMESIIQTILSLQTLSVESNVPVGSAVDQTEQTRNNSVESVT
jgi:hypothetical protein